MRWNDQDLTRRRDRGTVNRTYLSKPEKGASYPRLEIIAELAHYAFWVELARAATAAVPEKANAPTV